MRKKILLLLILFYTHYLFAQKDSSDIIQLGDVVVTGEYNPGSIKNSVYQIKVISADLIKKIAPSTLQDVLKTQLNIRFSHDNATGGSNINMLGLTGQYVKILIDGVPIIGRQGISNEVNINEVDINTIERIEIVEGPMSVIYGADALAGVINIITKKKTHHKYSVNAKLHEESAGNEYGFDQGSHNQYLGINGNYKNWYGSGGIGRNLFNGWKDSVTGRELAWHRKRQIIANALLGYQTNDLHLFYRLEGLDELITNPANLPGGGQPAVDQDYITIRLMQHLHASYNFNKKIKANAVVSHTHFTRQVYSTLFYPGGDVKLATAPGLHSQASFEGVTFRSDIVYNPLRFISFQPGVDINIESGEGERIKKGIQQINDYAFYLTSEIKPNAKIQIRPGVRFIKNSVYNAPPLIPSINTLIQVSPSFAIRAAYAKGFRSPSIRELYYNFFDANHTIIGNPDLQAEHSNSFTASVTFSPEKFRSAKLKSVLSGFNNHITNMIGFSDNAITSTTTYLNISRYKTRGLSLINHINYKKLDASLGFSHTGRHNDYAETNNSLPEFKWSGELNTNVSFTFPKAGLQAGIYYKFTGRLPYYIEINNGTQKEIKLAETNRYHWADITVNKKLGKTLTLHAGIRNLFNITTVNNSAIGTVHSPGSVLQIGNGRSCFTQLVFNWEKK